MESLKLTQAIQQVLELGKDGNEHLVVLRGQACISSSSNDMLDKGEVILERDGEPDRVEIGPEIFAQAFRPGDVFVHNHPNSSCSLSLPDIGVAAQQRGEIWAVTADGGRYWAKAGKRYDYIDIGAIQFDISQHLIWEVIHKRIDEETAKTVRAHLVNTNLALAGLVEYRAVIGSGLREALAKLPENFRKDCPPYFLKDHPQAVQAASGQ